MDPKGKPSIFPLNDHGNKTTPNDLLLYLWISVSLSPHLKHFLHSWQLIYIPTTGNMQRMINWNPQSTWDVCILPFPSRLRAPCGRWDRKILPARGSKWLQGNCFPDTIGQMCKLAHSCDDMDKTCTNSVRTKPQDRGGKVATGSTLTEELLALYWCQEREHPFSSVEWHLVYWQ